MDGHPVESITQALPATTSSPLVATSTARREGARRRFLPLARALAFGLGLVLMALAAALSVPPATGQTAFPEPTELSSSDGVLSATLTAEEQEIELAGERVGARIYNGAFVGPTLRVRPGDRIELELVNALPEPTNLHFHGLHVSPSGESDNIFREVKAGETARYSIELPADHAEGTFWYHSHQHHLSEEQLFGGLSGLLIVNGLSDLLPAELRGIEQRTIALKDFQLTNGAITHDNIDSNAPTTRTVNGQVAPSLTIAPGETQLWHLANIGADIFYELQFDGHVFHVIAEDGNPVWQVRAKEHLVLPPGKRFDVLVQGGALGSHELKTLAYDQGGDQYPEVVLAAVTVTGAAQAPAELPAGVVPGNDLTDATMDHRRTLVFSQSTDGSEFFIDGQIFDPNRVDQQVRLGAVEEWTIRNIDTEQHPFHIHVDDFQVISVNGEAYAAASHQDVVILPIKGEVVIRIPFRDFTGTFVYHCHILAHEDKGMMGVVNVVG